MKSIDVLPILLVSSFVLIVPFVPPLDSIFHSLSHRFLKDSTRVTDDQSTTRLDVDQAQHDHATVGRSPWTHEPICTPRLDVLSSSLCIYTISTFNNNTGISIFTNPSIAASLADLPIISSPSSSPVSPPTPPPYRLAAIPGKGQGLFATRPIPRLTPILTTHPVLLARTEMILSTPEREHYLRLALSQLPISTQKSYYDLVRLYNIEDFAAQDVVRANSFEIGLPSRANISANAAAGTTAGDPIHKHTVLNDDGSSTVMHLAIFPDAARLNHACSPNAMYYLVPDTLTHVVHATRDIAVGEEITVSYIGVMQGIDSRRRMLREGFGFECGCERCLREEKGTHGMGEGDGGGGNGESGLGMLGRMRSYEAWLKLWVLGEVPQGWEGVEIGEAQVEEILTMYLGMFEDEGLEGFMDDAYKLVSATEWVLGKKAQARRYGKAASEVVAIRYGPKHADLKKWVNFGRDVVQEYIQGLRG